ncbi:MAG: LamG domain-containing protein, partial [Lentisphaeria bacterium]|nr:LamG domain-containing protein [Lentisphaeria bacterium]
GERYRITLTPNGGFFFGLKDRSHRADLHGKGLVPGQWHRITGVFQRPDLDLYLDGKRVASAKWDYDMDSGGSLHIGAKAGRLNFFQGEIDQIHIYPYARAPQPDDKTRYTDAGGKAMPQMLKETETDQTLVVDTGRIRATLSRATGAIIRLTAGEKTLVDETPQAPVFCQVLESATYDGLTDLTPGEVLDASWDFDGLGFFSRADGQVSATGTGRLLLPNDDVLQVQISYLFTAGSRHVRVNVKLTPQGRFNNRFLRSVGYRQPLVLNQRKRVVQAGDQGLRWDVRHRYQFHTHVRFMMEPDHNWWRHFHIDQNTDHSYSMWRAESEITSPLVSFRGRQAPGYMSAYDQQGGALFAYREFAQRAPKGLYVNAQDGGEQIVYFHAPSQPALAVSSPLAKTSVFGKPHAMDWIFFEGEEAFEAVDRELANAWGQERLASEFPNRLEPIGKTLDLWNAAPAPTALSPIVEGGVPIPRGAIASADQARLFLGDRETPLHTTPLAYWPDHSIKWLKLAFPLRQDSSVTAAPGSGEGDEVRFRVTRRKGDDVPARLVFGKNVRKGTLGTQIQLTTADGQITIDTGTIQLALGTGARWLRSLKLGERELLATNGQPQAWVDFLRPAGHTHIGGTTHPQGKPDPGPVTIDKIEVEESNGLRAVVRLEGMAQAQEPAKVIIRLETWAGRPFVRLFHTVEFLHDDPREAFVLRLGLRLPLALDATTTKLHAGGQDGPTPLPRSDRVGLRQTSHLNYEAWSWTKATPWRDIVQSGHRSRGWLDASDATSGLCVIQRNMWQEAPKELSYDAKNSTLTVGYWPGSSPLMDCRRYSDYPHRGQGESTPVDARWVRDDYYKNDPFKGVTRTHETILFLHDARMTPQATDSVAADFQSRPLVHTGWEWYARTGVTMPLAPADSADFKRLNANMDNLSRWWLFHQDAWGWYGFWNFGDVQHHYRSGYGRIFPPNTLARILALPEKERAQAKPRGEFRAHQDYSTQHDWAYDNGRWGWSNTEGLIGHFMSQMYLRTGRRDLFFFIEGNARHSRDVDARHAGKWFGLGTRHGVQHWSDGNHEERQTTFTEQRFHYLLTGEYRTREWNQALTDGHYSKGICRNHASHSGRTYGLLTRWEITGDEALGGMIRKYMRTLATPKGVAISTPIAFPDVKAPEIRGLHDGSMFFHAFGGMHALLEYYYLTEDPQVRASIIATADHVVGLGTRVVGGMHRKIVAFAARHADDPIPYQQALTEWAKGRGVPYVYQQVTANPAHWSGETSFLRGNVSGGLFWANDALYTMGALPSVPRLSDAQEATIRETEERLPTPPLRLPKGSWQNGYDKPAFKDYFKDRLLE